MATQKEEFCRLDTEVGTLFVGWNAQGITMVEQRGDEASFAEQFRARFGHDVTLATCPAWLREAFAAWARGEDHPQLRYDLRDLTPFQQSVLRQTCAIPRGEVRTYGAIAQAVGRPGASRAVGTALAKNPIPIFIPCHRVVRSGEIGRYSGGKGVETKRDLLRWEGVALPEIELLPV